ncbi:MAG: dimethylsulfoniopropionate demethylase [Gammaproteobacteria bacterium]|nr:dimethylsulfoniopropionate demethylase [Gammaproteobacteria bacterium]
MSNGLNFSCRLRRTPYTARAEEAGVRGFSVVNHMLLPKAYARSVEEDYWHLREHVQIWDVACQRQVQIKGPDAAQLIQWMTPRNIDEAEVGDCLYLPLIDEQAGMINDPVLLKISENCFWLSIADSDVLLFAKGLALGLGLKVDIAEPDVSPLAVQGPKAEAVMEDLFGDAVRKINFFKFGWFEFQGSTQLIARSGYSRQGGFEIYLQGAEYGAMLWDAVCDAGQAYNIAPGCPNIIERIEGGLLSYGNDMTRDNNPLEMGLSRFCSMDDSVNYLGREALRRIASEGVQREIRAVVFEGEPCPACATRWPVTVNGQQVGAITSAAWSPRLKANVGLALIDRDFWESGQPVDVWTNDSVQWSGRIGGLPL